MPVSPELAEMLAKELLQTYIAAEERLLARVAERLANGIDSPGWAERKLAEIQTLRNEVQRELEMLRSATVEEVTRAIQMAYNRGAATAGQDLKALQTPPAIAFGAIDQEAMRTMIEATVGTINATHLRVLRFIEDVYRDVISEASAQVLLGSVTRRQAAQLALDRFAVRGITGFIDSTGRRWALESYVEMALRSSAGQAAVQGHIDRLTQTGHDLVIVSDAPEECPLCRPWEGRVLSLKGVSPGYATFAQATAAGLFHPGCRHSIGLFVAGLTNPMKNTGDPIGYLERQQQRYLERNLRMWKRREAVALSDEAARYAASYRASWHERLLGFIADNDRKRLRYREGLSVI